MQPPKTLREIGDEIVADLESKLETEADIYKKIDVAREIVSRWEREHIKPGSEWHAAECCVDELLAELKTALA